MDNITKLAIYEAQVKNVKSLKSALRQVKRSINFALRSNDAPVAEAFTKTYALLFCAWAEANFSKVIHTPHAFETGEIAQINAAKSGGISSAWRKSVELGMRHVEAKRSNFSPNTKKKIESIIQSHVFDPTQLRNKLAHGQWSVALNRENDAINSELTAVIGTINIVELTRWQTGHEVLAEIVEALIESPQRAFMRDWYTLIVRFEQLLEASRGRSIAEHTRRLKSKDTRTKAHSKRT